MFFIAIINNKFAFTYIILKNSFKRENAFRALYFDKCSPIVCRESKNIGVHDPRWEKVISARARALKHILFHDASAHRYIGTHSGS